MTSSPALRGRLLKRGGAALPPTSPLPGLASGAACGPCATRQPRASATMPRSFLVRKPSDPNRKPNYSELQDSSPGEWRTPGGARGTRACWGDLWGSGPGTRSSQRGSAGSPETRGSWIPIPLLEGWGRAVQLRRDPGRREAKQPRERGQERGSARARRARGRWLLRVRSPAGWGRGASRAWVGGGSAKDTGLG